MTSYFEDHNITPKAASQPRLNPDIDGFFADDGQVVTPAAAVQFFTALRGGSTSVPGNDHGVIDDIVSQLMDDATAQKKTRPAARKFLFSLDPLPPKSKDACPICVEPHKELCLALPCKHEFHKSCIFPWLRLHNTCPCCRLDLPTDDKEYEVKMGRAGKDEEEEEEDYDPLQDMYG